MRDGRQEPAATLPDDPMDELTRASQTDTVSVVIPAYRSADTISECLDSVIAQSHAPLDIIVVNDGSPDTDALERVLQPYNSRIRYLRQENRGPSGARNLGIRQSRGKYVAFLDSDDTWCPDHLAQQLEMFSRNPSLGLVYSDYLLLREGMPVGRAFVQEPQNLPVTFEKLLSTECIIGTSSTVALRQSLMDAGLFDESFRCCEDFDLWLRMAFRGVEIGCHPGMHAVHKILPGSLSSDQYAMKRARIEVYRKTVSTLPLTKTQQDMIHRLIVKNEARCETDLSKGFLRARDYSGALQAAQRASGITHHWKMRATVLALRRIPHIFRWFHVIYEGILGIRNRIRAGSFKIRMKISGKMPYSVTSRIAR